MFSNIYIYIYYQSKVFDDPKEFLFFIQNVFFLMKQVKRQNGFICVTKNNLPELQIQIKAK